MFGATVHRLGAFLAEIVPNLQMYVPPRELLLGDAAGISLRGFVAMAALHAFVYASGLLAAATVLFHRRDLQ